MIWRFYYIYRAVSFWTSFARHHQDIFWLPLFSHFLIIIKIFIQKSIRYFRNIRPVLFVRTSAIIFIQKKSYADQNQYNRHTNQYTSQISLSTHAYIISRFWNLLRNTMDISTTKQNLTRIDWFNRSLREKFP